MTNDEFKLTEEGIKPIEDKPKNNLQEALSKIVGKKEPQEIEKPQHLPKAEESYYPQKKEIPKEIKEEMLKEFKQEIKTNEITKNQRLISQGNLIGFWIVIGILLLLLIISMVLKFAFLNKLSNKDFSPNITNNITIEPANTTNQNFNNYQIENNHTILVQPNITIINVINGTGA